VTFPRTHTLAQVRAEAGEVPPNTRTGRNVSVAGRVILSRDGGKLCFATLRDGTGDLQIMIALDAVGPEMLLRWRRDVDLGDQVGVAGEVITTKRGELTVRAESFVITSKAIRPLPDKHKGLTDPEARVRARYVDLIVRPEAREVAYIRSTVVHSVRDSLHTRGFTEVETPVLQLIHGGANARPFETHINAYDLELYLRIATELHLKRLIVGGMEKVFEVGRQFRNEGVDFKHNPEFTSLEVYETYGDYNTMRVLTQEIIQEAATAVYGSPIARRAEADGPITEYDLSGNWPVKTICQAVSEALGEEITPDTPASVLHQHAREIGLELEPSATWGHVLEEIYGELCESTTTTPVFYTDFPKENSPLAREHRAGHGVLGADRSARATRAACRPIAASGRRRSRGDAGRRRLPRGPGVWHAADRRHGNGHRPTGDEPDRARNSRNDLVPASKAADLSSNSSQIEADRSRASESRPVRPLSSAISVRALTPRSGRSVIMPSTAALTYCRICCSSSTVQTITL
jgi:lysyl-tRNA synthetase class 2